MLECGPSSETKRGGMPRPTRLLLLICVVAGTEQEVQSVAGATTANASEGTVTAVEVAINS